MGEAWRVVWRFWRLPASFLAGLVLASALCTPMLSATSTSAPGPACQPADVGGYDGVVVGPDPGRARYVWTGHRLADDDPRWREWGALWETCRGKP